MHEWRIIARDNSNLDRLGEVSDYQSLTMVPRFNAPGSWELNIDASSPAASWMTWGNGLLVLRDGVEFFSGPVSGLARKWTPAGDRLEVSGRDDAVWLARRLAYPEAPALTTSTDAYDIRTGVASTVMREFVGFNMVDTLADASRVVPGITFGPDPVLGSSVTGRGRFQPVDELLRELALAGGDLGFRVVQNGPFLDFQVYDPADLTGVVVFSATLGNLAEYDFKEDGPEANFVVVGGAGEGAARAFVSGGDSTSITRYGRSEAFVDRRDTGDAGQLGQARDEELTERAEQTALSATPVDTGAFEFGTDYGLGDRVTVVVDGTPLQDVVREVHITLTPDAGLSVTPVIGTPGRADPKIPLIFDRMRRLERRLQDLERKL